MAQQNINLGTAPEGTDGDNNRAAFTKVEANFTEVYGSVSSHVASTSNPHSVTKTQVGLSNVDNTSDANKPVSTATQTALGLKADSSTLTAHTGNTSNPHSVTKAQVGLSNVENTSDLNKPISTATQTALDLKASTASLTAHTGDTANPHAVTKAQVGLANVDNTSDASKPISTATQTALNAKAANGAVTTSGLTQATARILGRTTASAGAIEELTVGTGLTLATGSLTANVTSVNTLTGAVVLNTGNVAESGNLYYTNARGIGSTLTGFASADGTVTATDTILTALNKTYFKANAAQTGLASKADSSTLTAHTGNTSNPHSVTKAQVGLANVDNTTDLAKPISTATQTALDLKAPLASPTFTGTVSGVTKSMVGLANVDNTSDASKPVSTAQQTALNLKANLASPTFTGTVAGITKAMVGLGNVDNTSDASKPVSTAQQTALDLKAPLASPALTGTPTAPTAVTGTSTTQLATTAFVAAAITASGGFDPSNPGPIGDITPSTGEFTTLTATTLIGEGSQITGLSSTQVAEGTNLYFTNAKAIGSTLTGYTEADGTISATDTVLSAIEKAAYKANAALTISATKASAATLTAHTDNVSNPHSVTKAQVGLANVDNTSDANKPVSTATQTALDLKASLTELAAHTTSTSNPHSVTKAQVGLANVDNTSDASKPVSTAQQTALDLKAPLASPTFTGTPAAPTAVGGTNTTQVATTAFVTSAVSGKADSSTLTSHTGNTSNPHSVTKSQVGLSNVDNTTDLAKPISTATQTALDLKANLASPTFTGTVSGITKAMVGLSAVDNTSDANKPLSNAVIAALGDYAENGDITQSGLNVLTNNRLLGRADPQDLGGPVEEIAIGTGLLLSSGVLSATGGSGGTVTHQKSATIAVPGAGDTATLLYTTATITLSRIATVLVGSSSPSVTWNIKYASTRNATGTDLITVSPSTTSVTTAEIDNTFASTTIPANNFVWVSVSAINGTVDEFHLTLDYTA